MSTPALDTLASEARQLIADGQFVEARKVVLAYCHELAGIEANYAALQNGRDFLNWALKTVAAARSHALLRRSELNRASGYANSGRGARTTWHIVS